MGIEIERKFLVVSDAWRAQVADSRYIAQAYLGGDQCSVRVRIDAEHANINIKGLRVGRVRTEYEYPVPVPDAKAVMSEFAGARVEKQRHRIYVDDLCWEIDEFLGANAPLVVAEVELDHADQPVARPAWLGEEVTDDRRYYNVFLAASPYSRWQHG